jgi:hypothetical protein
VQNCASLYTTRSSSTQTRHIPQHHLCRRADFLLLPALLGPVIMCKADCLCCDDDELTLPLCKPLAPLGLPRGLLLRLGLPPPSFGLPAGLLVATNACGRRRWLLRPALMHRSIRLLTTMHQPDRASSKPPTIEPRKRMGYSTRCRCMVAWRSRCWRLCFLAFATLKWSTFQLALHAETNTQSRATT